MCRRAHYTDPMVEVGILGFDIVEERLFLVEKIVDSLRLSPIYSKHPTTLSLNHVALAPGDKSMAHLSIFSRVIPARAVR